MARVLGSYTRYRLLAVQKHPYLQNTGLEMPLTFGLRWS